MTEVIDTSDTAPSSAHLDRIAQLRARRGQTTPHQNPSADAIPTSVAPSVPTSPSNVKRHRKRHVAREGRIIAAGLGATTMFGIVGVLGWNHPVTAVDPPGMGAATTSVNPAAQPIQVVVHHVPALVSATAEPASSNVAAAPAPVEPAAPIELTANPIVHTVTVPASAAAPAPAPAPAATTSGSQ